MPGAPPPTARERQEIEAVMPTIRKESGSSGPGDEPLLLVIDADNDRKPEILELRRLSVGVGPYAQYEWFAWRRDGTSIKAVNLPIIKALNRHLADNEENALGANSDGFVGPGEFAQPLVAEGKTFWYLKGEARGTDLPGSTKRFLHVYRAGPKGLTLVGKITRETLRTFAVTPGKDLPKLR
jgi:hypothetical protein